MVSPSDKKLDKNLETAEIHSCTAGSLAATHFLEPRSKAIYFSNYQCLVSMLTLNCKKLMKKTARLLFWEILCGNGVFFHVRNLHSHILPFQIVSRRGLRRVVGPYENVKYLARRRTSISCCQTLPSSFSAALQDLHDGGTNFKIGILPNVTSQIQKNNTCI